MRNLFLWFYCLPIPDAALLFILATAAFLLLRKRFGNTAWWKTGIPLLFACWITVILFGTLGQRSAKSIPEEPILTPLASYYSALTGGSRELYRANFMNAALFYPAGLLGCALLPAHWKPFRRTALTVCVFALLSISIEYIQYRFSLGLAETDDVIHNTLGTLLGALACFTSVGRALRPDS